MKPSELKGKKESRILTVTELRVKRDSESNVPTISGYAAVFNSLSEDLGGFREKIEPGAFKDAIKISDTRALFNHDANYVLGRQSNKTLRIKEDDKGLFMEVDPPDTQLIRDLVIAPIERRDITQQSFGFIVDSDKWEGLEDRANKMPTRTILKVAELFDVSPVTFPAYPDTKVAARSMERAAESLASPPFMLLTVPELLEAYSVEWQETRDKVEPGLFNKKLFELASKIMSELKIRLLDNLEDIGDPSNVSGGDPADPSNGGNSNGGDPSNASETMAERLAKQTERLNRMETLKS